MTAEELASVTSLSADNSANKEVPIILNTTEYAWTNNTDYNTAINPTTNNIVYVKAGQTSDPSEMVDYAALVDSTGYTTFEEAWSNITNKSKLTLLKDYTYETSPKWVYTNKAEYSIDLNGHILDFNNSQNGLYVYNEQTVNIYDSVGNGELKNNSYCIFQKNGTLSIYGGKITSINDAIAVYAYGNLNIYGGQIDTNNYYAISFGRYDDNKPSTLTISGGVVNGGIYLYGNDYDNNTFNMSGGTINGMCYFAGRCSGNITGGTLSGETALYIKTGVWNISGGTFVSTLTEHTDFEHSDNGFKPTGAAIVIEACNYPAGNPTINISGGTFVVNSQNSYGIELYNYNGNVVTVEKIENIIGTHHTFTINP